jgi:hypothetical protein
MGESMVIPNKARLLTQQDINGQVWKKIQDHLNARLLTMRAKNDGNLTADETAKVRGRIAEIKNMIELGNLAPSQPVNADE